MLQFKVTNQTLTLNQGPKVVADSQGYLKASFEFSEDWEGTIKIAQFSRSDPETYFFSIALDTNNECMVPWEVLAGEGSFVANVYGNNDENADNKIITTNPVTIKVNASGLVSGELPDTPTEGLEGSTLSAILTAKTDAENAATTATDKASEAEASATTANQKAQAAAGSANLASEKASAAADSAADALAYKNRAEELAGVVVQSTPEGYTNIANVVRGLAGFRFVIDPVDNGINILEESEVVGE